MEEYEEGREFFINDMYNDALIKFQAANKSDPDNLKCLHALGQTFGYLGDYESSIKFFDNVLLKDPNHLQSIIGKSIPLSILKEYSKALKLLNTAIEIHGEGIFFARKAIILKNMNKPKSQVMKCFDDALEINHEDPFVWFLKGITLSYYLNWDQALSSYDKALENCNDICILDDNVFVSVKDILVEKLGVYYSLNEFKDGLDCTKQLLTAYPRSIEALFQKAHFYYLKADRENSLRLVNKALNIDSENIPSLNLKANIFSRDRDYNTALNLYKKILKLDPENELAFSNITITYFLQKKYQKALDITQEALEVNSKNSYALYWGSAAARKLKNLPLARKYEKMLNDPEIDTIFLEKNLQEKIVNEPWRLKNCGYDFKFKNREFKLKDRPGRLDILYENKDNGDYVVVELKVVRASKDTYDQIYNYMDSIKETIGRNKRIKGLVIATGQDDQFKDLLKNNKDISYLDYYKLGLG